ncbi:TAXI family TRAP transporter solute-binding subunit [bacterium LRH843]|nr:TAXI family TRAP transporter solute-binding subunit [bacterium LRH843]
MLVISLVALLFIVGCVDETGQPVKQDEKSGESATSGEVSSDLEGYKQETENYKLRFTSAGETGIYYALGAIFAKFWTDELPNVTASSAASNGSVQNLIFMSQKEADVGLVMSGILSDGYYGRAGFEGQPYENVRILAGLYPNYNNVVVREGAGIESIKDVAGKDFVPGSTGSGTEIASQQIFEAYDMTFDDFTAHFVGFSETSDLMRNKQIVGTNINSGIPTAAVSEMLSTADGKLISIDEEQIKMMVDKYDFYVEATIPAGTYNGQDEDVRTTAMPNFLVADADMPDDVAYDLVKSFWEKLDKMKGSHGVVEQFDIKNVTLGSGDIPFHPGAQAYYEEVGVWDKD